MTVAPPEEVSTQVKLVFPFAPLVGYLDRGGGLLPRGSSPWRGALGSRPLCNRELGRRAPLSRHSGWDLAPAGRVHASPPLEFSGETPRPPIQPDPSKWASAHRKHQRGT